MFGSVAVTAVVTAREVTVTTIVTAGDMAVAAIVTGKLSARSRRLSGANHHAHAGEESRDNRTNEK